MAAMCVAAAARVVSATAPHHQHQHSNNNNSNINNVVRGGATSSSSSPSSSYRNPTRATTAAAPRAPRHTRVVAAAAASASTVSAAAAVAADSATSSSSSSSSALCDSLRPPSADCAKTLVAIANTGTISTICDDGVALGTFASYIQVPKSGEIVLRMRADALHTTNITREPRCSLYVQPATQPPGVLSRATLIGKLEQLDADAAAKASEVYNAVHGENVGVDAAESSDVYFKLIVDRVFYVGGLGSDKRAEVVSAADFLAAAADPLCKHALGIVEAMNGDRYQDVLNFARASLPGGGEPAEARMLWADRLGFDVRAITAAGAVMDVRVPFTRDCTTLNQALSALTMLAQVMWEEEKQYTPVPVPPPEPEPIEEDETA
eukprot:CAMPEP_0197587078 /NCGR_PEP_ID=MMETSP1326-20131121/8825_1 /TAXON_ID=1155430 /ORGANISM="Genus nov. species nov., Strain RCC2288" /LENGTH=377 /DNA_ID=CAMNT_0043151769 /DNA_START=65 /DNA_END=1198 /DNA_ORIENTATION=-